MMQWQNDGSLRDPFRQRVLSQDWESFRTLPASSCMQLIGLLCTLLRPVSGLLESRASEVASALNHLEQRTSDKQAATQYVSSIHAFLCCCCLVCSSRFETHCFQAGKSSQPCDLRQRLDSSCCRTLFASLGCSCHTHSVAADA